MTLNIDKEPVELYETAVQQYEDSNKVDALKNLRESLRLNPSFYEARKLLAIILVDVMYDASEEERPRLFSGAIAEFEKASKLGEDAELYCEWGKVIYREVLSVSGEKAVKAYERSYEKFRKAIELDPNYREAYREYGWALANHAKEAKGEEAESLLKKSAEMDYKADLLKEGSVAQQFEKLKATNDLLKRLMGL